MKLIFNEQYFFNFAGEKIKGKYLGEKILNDGNKALLFQDSDGYKYPIKKEQLCGNSIP